MDNQILIGILLDESIIALDGDNFYHQLRLFIISKYIKKMRMIKLDKKIIACIIDSHYREELRKLLITMI